MTSTIATPSSGARDHLSGYQARDWEVVDYAMYEEPRSGLWFRGPQPMLHPGQDYFVCLGAAQTFGCFCDEPFPALLAQRLGLPAVNLGYGGAGPRFYNRHPELLELINGARFVIVQVMSARSEDNSVFESGGLEYLIDRASGQRISAADGYGRLLSQADQHLPLPAPMRRALRTFRGPHSVKRVLDETRENWIESYRTLFSNLRVPSCLFWFSQRTPRVHRGRRARWFWQRYDGANAMFGEYPQLVNPRMMQSIRPLADRYVACTSRRGVPQPLTSRFTGQPIVVDYSRDRPDLAERSAENAYYPSPAMHQDAARALDKPCRALLRMTSHARTQ